MARVGVRRGPAAIIVGMLIIVTTATNGAGLLENGGFERWADGQPVGWNALWTREAGTGTLTVDRRNRAAGACSVRIVHRGPRDWSFNHSRRLPVRPGDILEYAAKVLRKPITSGQGVLGGTGERVNYGVGSVTLCVTAYDNTGQVVDWFLGGREAVQAGQWEAIQARFVIPGGVAQIQPRLIGHGPAMVWFDDARLTPVGHIDSVPAEQVRDVVLTSDKLAVRFDPTTMGLVVTDRRCNRTWKERGTGTQARVTAVQRDGQTLVLDWVDAATVTYYRQVVRLESNAPEIVLTLAPRDSDPTMVAMPRAIDWPEPFETTSGDYLVIPMNEGISYPVEDASIEPMTLIAYGGHGICMAFWGVTNGQAGYMGILETSDDAAIRIDRHDGRLQVDPQWHSQKGRFGYPRRLRYVFFDGGGHVAMCKRYRRYAQDRGTFKTLADKRRENPNVDLLIGAVNVWCWERDAVGLVQDMQAAGIERILWSHRADPQTIRRMNAMDGVLTSRYDIYQDLMDPQIVATKLRGRHADWTQAGWPDDLMRDARGDWRKGWRVRGTDGQMYPCGVLCDRRAVDYAHRRVPAELQTHPYRCRFIDTTTASPWRECYDPRHPMTRSDSRHWKMELLRFMSEDMHLVTGSETGHDAAVPYVHYFEGMMSLGPYRVPDAGRDMIRIWTDVPQRVAKFQLGHRYRLPLWELVYHDCVVAQWYWGDYNNKLPSLWDKRNLFNVLYATPPMFMFRRDYWQANRDRFVRSYKTICPVVRAVGYMEMTDHRFLTADRDVQQTVFADGTRITVNFGPTPYRTEDGVVIPPNGHRVERATSNAP